MAELDHSARVALEDESGRRLDAREEAHQAVGLFFAAEQRHLLRQMCRGLPRIAGARGGEGDPS